MKWPCRVAAAAACAAWTGAASAAPDTRPSLCAPGEVAIFSCALATGRIVSLCASPDLGETSGHLRYLYGRLGKVELVHPDPGTLPCAAFLGGIVGPGGGDFIRFRRGGATYTLESIMTKTGPR